jgi:hypothetical protein
MEPTEKYESGLLTGKDMDEQDVAYLYLNISRQPVENHKIPQSR